MRHVKCAKNQKNKKVDTRREKETLQGRGRGGLSKQDVEITDIFRYSRKEIILVQDKEKEQREQEGEQEKDRRGKEKVGFG